MTTKKNGIFILLQPYLLIVLFTASTVSSETPDSLGLINCLTKAGLSNVTTATSSSYTELLQFSLQNLRYTEQGVKKPQVIIIPVSNTQVQSAVKCSVKTGWQIKVRSGGHSYEGLSSTSDVPFVIIDLMKMDEVVVNVGSRTASVQAGATLGQIYAAVAASSPELGFPAGVCPTIGSGGHLSGGGFSTLARKYGLAADNVLDALVVDPVGRLLNRKQMGEDVFWALRGGGGGSFGIVVSWTVNLVSVPKVVTYFNAHRVGRAAVSTLFDKWQRLAPVFDENLFMRTVLNGAGGNDVQITFNGVYTGTLQSLLTILKRDFPELGMSATECTETNWLGSVGLMTFLPVNQVSNRTFGGKNYFKNKSDFLTKPVPADTLNKVFDFLAEISNGLIIIAPMGGALDRIPSGQIAYPYRAGYRHLIQYIVSWGKDNVGNEGVYVDWMRRLYGFMGGYVASNPRASYVNYLDLDLGSAMNGTATVEEARRQWGSKYFNGNFDRLVKVKTMFDPSNVFRHSQSIPVALTK